MLRNAMCWILACLVLVPFLSGCSGAPAEPTVQPTAALTATPTSRPSAAPRSASPAPTSSPVSTATSAPAPEISDALSEGYRVLVSLEVCAALLKETASRIESGELFETDAWGAALVVEALLESARDALSEPVPDALLQVAWDEAQISLPLVSGLYGEWAHSTVSSAQVASRMVPVERQVARMLAAADDSLAATYGSVPQALVDLRAQTLEQLRADLAAAPTASATGTEAPPADVALEIGSVQSRVDALDDLVFVGELRNTGTGLAESVHVTITLFAKDGGVMGTQTGDVLVWQVPAGETVPFTVDFSEDPGPFARFEAVAQGQPLSSWSFEYAHDLEVARETVTSSDDTSLSLILEAVSHRQEPVDWAQAVVTAYDADGNVVGVGSAMSLQRVIAPGQAATFDTDLTLTAPAASHRVLVEARVTEDVERPSLEITGLVQTVDAWGDASWIGEVTNRSSEDASSASVAITLTDADGALLAISSANALLSIIPAGESAPFEVRFWESEIAEVADVAATVEGEYPADYIVQSTTQDFQVVQENRVRSDANELAIAGKVRNTGKVAAQYVRVVVSAYDAGNQVVGVGSGYAELDPLAPDAVSPFEVTIAIAAPAVRYTLRIEGSPAT